MIQDVDIPIAYRRVPRFLCSRDRLVADVDLSHRRRARQLALYPLQRGWYVNFGFWDVKRTRAAHAPGHFNRLIEAKVAELGGIKSLYSDCYFSEASSTAATAERPTTRSRRSTTQRARSRASTTNAC